MKNDSRNYILDVIKLFRQGSFNADAAEEFVMRRFRISRKSAQERMAEAQCSKNEWYLHPAVSKTFFKVIQP